MRGWGLIDGIGTYDPIPKPPADGEGKPFKDIKLDTARAKYWLGVGAQPSDPAWRLLSMVFNQSIELMGRSADRFLILGWTAGPKIPLFVHDHNDREHTGGERGGEPECTVMGMEERSIALVAFFFEVLYGTCVYKGGVLWLDECRKVSMYHTFIEREECSVPF